MYILITKAEGEGNNSAFGQVFRTGEILNDDGAGERCCEGGRKYWRWDIKYEEDFKTIKDAQKKGKELGIETTIHNKCH